LVRDLQTDPVFETESVSPAGAILYDPTPECTFLSGGGWERKISASSLS